MPISIVVLAGFLTVHLIITLSTMAYQFNDDEETTFQSSTEIPFINIQSPGSPERQEGVQDALPPAPQPPNLTSIYDRELQNLGLYDLIEATGTPFGGGSKAPSSSYASSDVGNTATITPFQVDGPDWLAPHWPNHRRACSAPSTTAGQPPAPTDTLGMQHSLFTSLSDPLWLGMGTVGRPRAASLSQLAGEEPSFNFDVWGEGFDPVARLSQIEVSMNDPHTSHLVPTTFGTRKETRWDAAQDHAVIPHPDHLLRDLLCTGCPARSKTESDGDYWSYCPGVITANEVYNEPLSPKVNWTKYNSAKARGLQLFRENGLVIETPIEPRPNLREHQNFPRSS